MHSHKKRSALRLPGIGKWAGLSLVAAVALQSAPTTRAATSIYWDGTGTGWDSASNWSTDQTAATPDPANPPGSSDIATFVATTATIAQTINLNAPQAASGLATNASNKFLTKLVGGSGDQTLSLGTDGINHLDGGFNIGSTTAGQRVTISLQGAQTWTSSAGGTGAAGLQVFSDVSIGAGGDQTLTLSGSNTSPTVSGTVSDGAAVLSLLKTGTGTWKISGANTFTGTTTILSGTLSVSSLGNDGEISSSLGAPTGAANRTITLGTSTGTQSSGNLLYTGGTTTTDRTVTAGSTASGANALTDNGTGTLTWTGALTGAHSMFLAGTSAGGVYAGPIGITAGTLHKTGTGTWSFTNTASNYTTPLAIDQGTLSLPSVNASNTNGVLGHSSQTISISTTSLTGTLLYTGSSGSTDRNFSLAGNVANPSTVQVSSSAATLSLTGTVGGGGSLTKTGPGILSLTNNTYTGDTTVSDGTLSLALANLASTSSVAVASGAQLNLSYTGSDSISMLTLGGTVEPPGQYDASNASPFLSGPGSLLVTPEPGSIALLSIGGLGLLARRRRRPARR